MYKILISLVLLNNSYNKYSWFFVLLAWWQCGFYMSYSTTIQHCQFYFRKLQVWILTMHLYQWFPISTCPYHLNIVTIAKKKVKSFIPLQLDNNFSMYIISNFKVQRLWVKVSLLLAFKNKVKIVSFSAYLFYIATYYFELSKSQYP